MFYIGRVTDVRDETKAYLVKVTCPAIYGDTTSDWLECIDSFLFVPTEGTEVGLLPFMGDYNFVKWFYIRPQNVIATKKIELPSRKNDTYYAEKIYFNGNMLVGIGEDSIYLGRDGGAEDFAVLGQKNIEVLQNLRDQIKETNSRQKTICEQILEICTKLTALGVVTVGEAVQITAAMVKAEISNTVLENIDFDITLSDDVSIS